MKNEKQNINYNGKRSNIISVLKRKNIQLVEQVKSVTTQIDLTKEQGDALLKFEKNITRCANLSLYAENKVNGSLKYTSSHTCNHKACFICNFMRQKKIRRKYLSWFENNSEFLHIRKNKKEKLVTQSQYLSKWKKDGFKIKNAVKYDIMFLTLSVPHYKDNGFKGNKYYFPELRDAFNTMRRTPAWKSMVYGGEFGIEITKKENGLHIHIHSLVFVKRSMQNRNKLHKIILQEWNQLTVNPDSERDIFDQKTREGIKKGNKTLSDTFIDELNPKGATLINLNTIFSWNKGTKVRAKKFNSKEMLKAVMEAISYHFEPQAFDKENGEFDLPLLIELLPKLYNLRIYDRFGVLYGEKALSLKNNEFIEDLTEVSALLKGQEKSVVPLEENEEYLIANPAFVFHDPKENYKIILSNTAKERRIDLDAINKKEAFDQLGDIVKDMHTKGKVIVN